MSDPAWSNAPYEDAANFTFPTPQIMIHQQGNAGQIIVPVLITGPAYFEITKISGTSDGLECFGVCVPNYTGPNLAYNYYTAGVAAQIYSGGYIHVDGSDNGRVTDADPGVAGTTVRVYLDGAGHIAFACNETDWQGAYTDAQIAAGTGVVAMGFGTGGVVPFASFEGSAGGPQEYQIASSAASCKFPPIAGASYLPANTVLVTTQLEAQPGFPANITWEATNVPLSGGLNYSLDGGAWTPCEGTVAGSSGVATGPIITDDNFHTIAIQSAANQLVVTEPNTFVAVATPPGATTIIYSDAAGGFPYLAENGITIPGGPISGFIFSFITQVAADISGNITGLFNMSIGGQSTDGSGTNFGGYSNAGQFESSSEGGTPTVGYCGGFVGVATPVSGPASVAVATYSTISGTVTVSPSGANAEYTASLSNNGSLVTYASYDANIEPSWKFTSISFTVGQGYPRINPTFDYQLVIWGLAGESITLLTATCETTQNLQLTGTSIGGPPDSLQISHDGGMTFSNAVSYSTATGQGTLSFTAEGGILTGGVYPCMVMDPNTGVQSNIVNCYVTSESLTITTAAGALDSMLSIGGFSNDGPAAALDVSTDGGESWEPGTNYVPGEGTLNAEYSVDGPTLTTPGVLTIYVRDHLYPTVISNAYTLSIYNEDETITITQGVAELNGPLTLAGYSMNGPPLALDVSIDGGSTWPQELSGYTSAAGTTAAAWSGVGPVLSNFGTYVVKVRDHNAPAIVSAPYDVVLAPGFDIWQPPQAPSQDGTSAQPKPKLITTQLGDGYAVRCEDGINFNPRTQTCNWASISVANWATIEAFFEAHLNTVFYYQMPGDVGGIRKWKVTSWKRGTMALGQQFYTGCSAMLMEDFTPDDTITVAPPAPPVPFLTWTPPVKPAADGTGASIQARMNATDFGDAYIQQATDGLNYLLTTRSLSWDMVTLADWTAIEEFLYPRLNGVPFYYAFPGDPAGTQLWTVSALKIGTFNGEFYTSNTATLQIDYSINPASTTVN